MTHRVFEKIIRDLRITHLFDIGANVGSFAWHCFGVNSEIKIYLFEPDATNIRLLKKTIRTNERLSGVHLWEGVVSDRAGTLQFLVDDASGATGSIKDASSNAYSLHAAYEMSRKVEVPATCLDTYAESVSAEPGRIFLKIDVEGAEREVLAGAKAFIKKFRPFIIVECFDRKNLEPLAEADYVAFPLAENFNYLLIPREYAEAVKGKAILPNPNAEPISVAGSVPL